MAFDALLIPVHSPSHDTSKSHPRPCKGLGSRSSSSSSSSSLFSSSSSTLPSSLRSQSQSPVGLFMGSSRTHTEQNPTKSTIQPHRSRGPLNNAQKEQLCLTRLINMEKNKHIKTGVNKIIEMKNSMIEELVEQELLKKTKIQSLVDTKIHYKKQQKMSLHNAITHFKALKVNGGMSFLHPTISD